MEPIITYDHVDISYGRRKIIENVSFSAAPGQILAIAGSSGSGKSTLLKATMGLLGANGTVSCGDIWFDGKNMLELKAEELRRLCGSDIAMIWQDAGAALCPIRTIGAQCTELVAAHRNVSAAEARKQTLSLFQQLGLADGSRIWDSYPFALSGGMNQRVGVAMAMLLQPRVVLADEPTSALDVLAQQQVLKALRLMKQLYSTAIILVTHDMGVVRCMADTVLVLQDGKTAEYGAAAQVLQCPQHAYTKALLAAVPVLRRT